MPYDTAVPLLGMYLKEFKPESQRDISVPMFIVALFVIVKMWKQPKWPSENEEISKT